MGATHRRRSLTWAGVALSTLLASLWGFWGAVENFHEGWYQPTLAGNLRLMVVQYLAPMLLFLGATLASIRWSRAGALLHLLGAAGVLVYFRGAALQVLLPFLAGPLVLLAGLYWFGGPVPRRRASLLATGVVALVTFASGLGPALGVARRVDDGDRGRRIVAGNGVLLEWAPAGPGWPADGVSYDEAVRRTRYLSDDGRTLLDRPLDRWRLPTAAEVVRSQALHGVNCGGEWDERRSEARYARCRPDKEPPLWDPGSKIIYWWTATPADSATLWRAVYNGRVERAPRTARWGYLGFRAVREVTVR